ncbi:MAG: hypothetical protein QME79_11205 [Bacillota bacterium]|nr:hypothetical protein [Bacillota bacterium]
MAYLPLVEALAASAEVRSLAEGPAPVQLVTGLAGSQKALLAAALRRTLNRPLLVVTYNAYEAERLHGDLLSLVGAESLALFPALEVLPHEEIVQDPEPLVHRLRTYELLADVSAAGGSGQPATAPLVVVPVQALMRRFLPPEAFFRHTFALTSGQRIDLGELVRRLVLMGYERVDLVDNRGQFAVRGGIVDVFPLTSDYPYRIELWGDEVDSLRRVEAATQRSLERVARLALVPAREVVFPPEAVEEARSRLHEAAATEAARLSSTGRRAAARRLRERVETHAEALAERHYFPGVEQYLPFLVPRLATLLDYLPGALVVVDEPVRAREAAVQGLTEVTETLLDRVEKGEALPAELSLFVEWGDLQAGWGNSDHPAVYLSTLGTRAPGLRPVRTVAFPARTPELFHGRVERLAVEVKRWRREGFRVLLSVNSVDRAKHLRSALLDHGVEVGLLTGGGGGRSSRAA